MSKVEYPKMLYKSRTDYKTVEDIDSEEQLVSEGYGEFEVIILNQKPASVIEAEKKAIIEKAITEKVTAEFEAEKSKLLKTAQDEAAQIIANAQEEAAEIVKNAKKSDKK